MVVMTRFIIVLLVIAVISSFVSYLLWRLFKEVKIVKYCPSIICLLMAIYFFYLSQTVLIGFKDLAYIIMAEMLFAGFVTGLGTCLFIDYALPKLKR